MWECGKKTSIGKGKVFGARVCRSIHEGGRYSLQVLAWGYWTGVNDKFLTIHEKVTIKGLTELTMSGLKISAKETHKFKL